MIHRISRIDNRLDGDGELLIECFGDVEIYLSAEHFKQAADIFVPEVSAGFNRGEVIAVINEMSRVLPNTTEDWRARLTAALA